MACNVSAEKQRKKLQCKYSFDAVRESPLGLGVWKK